MTIPSPSPSPEFQSLTDESISKALGSLDLQNPVIIELGRLVVGYVEAARDRATLDSGEVQNLLSFQPRSPIEAAAKRLSESVLCECIVNDYRASRSFPRRRTL